ncbi:hypothetical protein NP493_1642g00034 [Ridgeia piscesae]|uniref:Uncharacterized protein n=1 Tax=Ridgeia piscesae TaxID=27915 RepID=A0AAD9NAX5_RIDPI|nr:hypothetical protein NP493_1642g00034 [Ridgeia piscesae]
MRAIVVLLFAVLALTFVEAQADGNEAADLSLSMNEESDHVNVAGDRVKRASGGVRIISVGGCRCSSWGRVYCHSASWGCYCHRHATNDGGCLISRGLRGAQVMGYHGAYCRCRNNTPYLYVSVYQ